MTNGSGRTIEDTTDSTGDGMARQLCDRVRLCDNPEDEDTIMGILQLLFKRTTNFSPSIHLYFSRHDQVSICISHDLTNKYPCITKGLNNSNVIVLHLVPYIFGFPFSLNIMKREKDFLSRSGSTREVVSLEKCLRQRSISSREVLNFSLMT